MHVQPAAREIRVTRNPLWAKGAIDRIAGFLAGRRHPVHVLEFGSGGSTIFLLRMAVELTTVEHHEEWANAVQEKAEELGRSRGLRLLLRGRPYDRVVEELRDGPRFDAVIVDGRERVDCLRRASALLRSDGIMVLDDSQRKRYWRAHQLLCHVPSETFADPERSTTIWDFSRSSDRSLFIRKRVNSGGGKVDGVDPLEIYIPSDLTDGGAISENYSIRKEIAVHTPLQRRLKDIGYFADKAVYGSPVRYAFERAELRTSGGRKYFRIDGTTYVERGGRLRAAERNDLFDVDTVFLDGRILDLTAAGAGRYAFFLLDSLPKLKVVQAMVAPLQAFDHIIVNSGAAWLTDLLVRFAGVDPARISAISARTPSFRMRRSEHIEGIRSERFTPAWVRDFLTDLVGSQGVDSPSSRSLLFISRQRAAGRRIANYDEFKDILCELGFKEIHAEDYSLEDIRAEMNAASVVVSPHGAGLSNIIFCRAGTTVVELFASHYTPQYKYLADEMNHRYVPFICTDPAGRSVLDRPDAGSTAEFNRMDMVVPCDAFKKAMSKVLKQ